MNHRSRRSLSPLPFVALSLVLALGVSGAAAAAGDPERAPRVVGGSAADASDWPSVAAIYFDGFAGCGGTVISPTAVLTAAHCVSGTDPAELAVGTGRRSLSERDTGQTIGVADYVIHPAYGGVGRADLAVLTLKRPTSAPAAQLPAPGTDAALTAPGSVLRVAGWGATTPMGRDPGSDMLLEADEITLQKRPCKRAYRREFMQRDQICTNGPRIGSGQNASSCYGDSGGPLSADTPAGQVLVGVVSYGGDRCGDPRFPSVYARVAPHVDWIYAAAG